jgi:hypothetical protein
MTKKLLMFKCPNCGVSFHDEIDLNSHLLFNHFTIRGFCESTIRKKTIDLEKAIEDYTTKGYKRIWRRNRYGNEYQRVTEKEKNEYLSGLAKMLRLCIKEFLRVRFVIETKTGNDIRRCIEEGYLSEKDKRFIQRYILYNKYDPELHNDK